MFSFCIITKNEKQNIERCILSLLPCEHEIVVVDTGSNDGTVEILREMSEKNSLINFYCFEWCDDFSKAKNYAIEQASNDFVCVIDSDEFIDSIDVDNIEELISKNPQKVGRIKRRNIFPKNRSNPENVEWINRIFSKKYYHYEGRIHEQVTRIDHEPYETYKASLCINHTGYDLTEEERKKKARRNIRLLESELKTLFEQICCNKVEELEGLKPESNTPQEQIPYILYQLGKSYYMFRDYQKAADYFEKGLIFDLDPKLEYVSDMVETYGYSLINSDRAKDAMFFESIYNEFSYTADFHFLMGLIYMNNAHFDEAISEFLKATTYSEVKTVGVNSYSAFYNIGVIYECLGNTKMAKEYYGKCGEYDMALKGLERLEKNEQ